MRSTVKLKCSKPAGISTGNSLGKHHKSYLSSFVQSEIVTKSTQWFVCDWQHIAQKMHYVKLMWANQSFWCFSITVENHRLLFNFVSSKSVERCDSALAAHLFFIGIGREHLWENKQTKTKSTLKPEFIYRNILISTFKMNNTFHSIWIKSIWQIY